MKIIKRIGLLILFSLAGAIIMYIYGSASLRGAFIQWESHGKPPEKAVKVVALNYVKTESGDIYRNCGNDCWIRSENPTPDSEYLPLKSCGNLPSLANYIDFKGVCSYYGTGMILRIDAIDKSGIVYSWNQNIGGEGGLILLLSPVIGAIAGLFIGFIILLLILFSDFLGWLQKRAQKKGASDNK